MLEVLSAVLHAFQAPLREVVLYGYNFRSFVAVNIDILKPSLLCKASEGCLRRLFKSNADFFQFLLSDCLMF
jgi:hypothetical protein